MTEDQTELDEETRQILEERLARLDENARHAIDAREFLAELRQKLKLSGRKGEPGSSDLSH